MDWFRSWHGAPTDNKWLVIARKAEVAPGMVSAVYWALLDCASQAQDRGSMAGFDIETYAAFSGWSEDDIAAVIAAMRAKGVITPDDRLSAWEKRQPKREDDSTQRVREFRERSNAMKHDVTQSNAPEKNREETEQNRAEQNRTEQRETDAPNGKAADASLSPTDYKGLVSQFGQEWVTMAVEITRTNNKFDDNGNLSGRYTLGTLRNWRKEGHPPENGAGEFAETERELPY